MITDIRMPIMDGLSLVEKIRQNGFDTKIIILTGFDEFAYAKKALQLKVSDYLLKPVSPIELTGLLTNIKKELDAQYRKRAKQIDLSRQADLSRDLVRQLAIVRLISGLDYSNFLAKHQLSPTLFPENHSYMSIVYDYDDEHSSINPEDYRTTFQQINPPGVSDEFVLDGNGVFVEILLASEGFEPIEQITELTEKKRSIIGDDTHKSVSAGLGAWETSIAAIRTSYLVANESLSLRYANGGARVYSTPGNNVSELLPDEKMIRRINKAIETRSFAELINLFESLITNLKEANATERHCRNQMTLVLSAMFHSVNRKKSVPASSKGLDASLLSKAGTFKTLVGLQRWFVDIVDLVREEVLEQRENSSLLMAEKARAYIDNHYSDSSLSLEDLCSHLGTSLSTFSRIFKTYQGMTFSEYLTNVRLDHAKKLMNQTDLRNKEVAFRVGFNSPHYFSHVFNRRNGYSPSTYRKALRLDASSPKGVR